MPVPSAFRAASFLAALAMSSLASAADLSLADVLTTSSLQSHSATGKLTGEAAAQLLREAGEDLEAGRIHRAAEAAAQLPKRIPLDDSAYVDALWLAVRVAEATGQPSEAMQAAREYLRFDPAGENAGRALAAVAKGEALAGNWEEAAQHFVELLSSYGNPAEHLAHEVFLGAAEACVQAHRPADARRALSHLADPSALSSGARASRTFWLLESLLLRDDPSLAVPAAEGEDIPLEHSIALRRALLFELRGEEYHARPIYADLAWERDALPQEERHLLDARMSALGL